MFPLNKKLYFGIVCALTAKIAFADNRGFTHPIMIRFIMRCDFHNNFLEFHGNVIEFDQHTDQYCPNSCPTVSVWCCTLSQ
jgi:hypothetical protein